MSKKVLINLGLVVALVVVFGVSFIIGGTHTDPEERFGGTDGAATSQIEESHPDYEPWFQPFFQPESSEVESGLFALQAGLGGVVLGFALGGLVLSALTSIASGIASGGSPSITNAEVLPPQ